MLSYVMMSKNCDTCPLDTGEFTNEQLRVCSNPSVICRDSLLRLHRALKTWDSLKDTGEITRNGILSFLSIQNSDQLAILMGENMGKSFTQNPDRRLVLEIVDSSMDSLSAKVSYDSYNKLSTDHANYAWALPEGAEITLLGAHSHVGDSDFKDELRRGMGLNYRWRSAIGSTFTGPIHEISLERGELAFNVFSTDLNIPVRPPL